MIKLTFVQLVSFVVLMNRRPLKIIDILGLRKFSKNKFVFFLEFRALRLKLDLLVCGKKKVENFERKSLSERRVGDSTMIKYGCIKYIKNIVISYIGGER
ncbi:hypothetical protein Hanom_Chr13g01200421 [Helianthus anomalus]